MSLLCRGGRTSASLICAPKGLISLGLRMVTRCQWSCGPGCLSIEFQHPCWGLSLPALSCRAPCLFLVSWSLGRCQNGSAARGHERGDQPGSVRGLRAWPGCARLEFWRQFRSIRAASDREHGNGFLWQQQEKRGLFRGVPCLYMSFFSEGGPTYNWFAYPWILKISWLLVCHPRKKPCCFLCDRSLPRLTFSWFPSYLKNWIKGKPKTLCFFQLSCLVAWDVWSWSTWQLGMCWFFCFGVRSWSHLPAWFYPSSLSIFESLDPFGEQPWRLQHLLPDW